MNTKEIFNNTLVNKTSITKVELNSLGYEWPPKKGWKKEVLTQGVSLDKMEIFLEIIKNQQQNEINF